MMAAQQHAQFTFPQSAEQSQQAQANWHGDQEQYLRNLLLADPLDASPASVSGTASNVSQSPLFHDGSHHQHSGSFSDDNGNHSSLSPVSTTSYQSLHEFIHQGSGTHAPSLSGASSNGGLHTPSEAEQSPAHGFRSKPTPKMESHDLHAVGNDFMGADPQKSDMFNPQTVDFFVGMMTTLNGNGPQMPINPSAPMQPMSMAQQMGMNGNAHLPHSDQTMAAAMLQQQYIQSQAAHHMQQQQQQQFAPQMNGVQQSFASQGQPFYYQSTPMNVGNVPFASDHLHAVHPAVDSRKRSAPATMATFGAEAMPAMPVQDNGPAAKKVRRRPSQKGLSTEEGDQKPPQQMPSQFVPSADQAIFNNITHMEVGSNATALAALERLKAKKRHAVELETEEKRRAAAANELGGPSDLQGKPSGFKAHSSAKPSSSAQAQKHEKKVAHNAIERRYRVNINSRIAALRNSVPALRELRPARKQPGKGKPPLPEDLVDGVPAATKLNKATILGKATEYIRYLKGRETRLVAEVAGLHELIRSLEGGGELLDLWRGEMERVVAEQEAMAKAAMAADLDDEYDEDEDDDDDDEEQKPSRSPTSSNGSSSRYMMGIFMGFSILGGGSEIIANEHATSSATEHAQNVLRASSGRVLGASHQLIKRSMQATNVKLGTMAHHPHHYDHVASHLLIVEALRGLALLACLAFIFWPWIARFVFPRAKKPTQSRHSSPMRVKAVGQEDEVEYALRRKEMLATLANPTSSPHQTDSAMRYFLHAPSGALGGMLSLSTLAVRQFGYRTGLLSRTISVHEEEQAATWCRLLELETSMGAIAQRSLFARLHTLFTVMTLPLVGFGVQSNLALLQPARVFGTIAISVVRSSNGYSFFHPFAERYWTKARRCRLLASDEAFDEDELLSNNLPTSSSASSDRWLDPVLESDLFDAVALCPAPTAVAAVFTPQTDSWTRATTISPLLSIAANQHNRQLGSIWTTLLSQIVQTTCPATGSTKDDDDLDQPQTCAAFVKHYTEAKLDLPLLSQTQDRDRLTSQITRLTLTAPRCPRVQIMCNVTFGAWALLMGNAAIARSVSVALVHVARQGKIAMPASAMAFVSLVLGEHEAAALASSSNGSAKAAKATGSAPTSVQVFNEVDALAAASLAWLDFLKLLSLRLSAKQGSKVQQDSSQIATSAVSIRRLLAIARAVRPLGTDDILSYLAPSLSHERLAHHRDSLASTASSTPSTLLAEDVHSIAAAAATASSKTTSSSPNIAAAAADAAAARVVQQNLDDSLDTLTDILAVLGRRAAMGLAFSKDELFGTSGSPDQADSGVEWASA